MKAILSASAALIATPTLADTGPHMHPHASNPAWLPYLVAGLAIAGAVTLFRAYRA